MIIISLLFLALIFFLGLLAHVLHRKWKINELLVAMSLGILLQIIPGTDTLLLLTEKATMILLSIFVFIYFTHLKFRKTNSHILGIILIRTVILSIVLVLLLMMVQPLSFYILLPSALALAFIMTSREDYPLQGVISIFALFTLMVFLQNNLETALTSLLTGIATGILASILVFQALRRIRKYHNIMLIGAALLAYLVAERLEGSGLFAVMFLGLMYSKTMFKHKKETSEKLNSFFKHAVPSIAVYAGLLISLGDLTYFLIALAILIITMIINHITRVHHLPMYGYGNMILIIPAALTFQAPVIGLGFFAIFFMALSKYKS